MKKILRRAICFAAAVFVMMPCFKVAEASGKQNEVSFANAVGQTVSEDGITFMRLSKNKEKNISSGYYYTVIQGAPSFYYDIKVRIPEEAKAEDNLSISFAKYTASDKFSGEWLTAFKESKDAWYAQSKNILSRDTGWNTFRLVLTMQADNTYNFRVLRVNDKYKYEELYNGSLLDNSGRTISSVEGWTVFSGGGSDGSICDIAQFECKIGSPDGDNTQLDTEKKNVKFPDFSDIENGSERSMYMKLYSLGLFNPINDGARPDDKLTKKQFADTLIGLYGIDTDSYDFDQTDYRDLSVVNDKACIIALQNGYLKAKNETLFGVNDNVTYGKVAAQMLKLLGYENLADLNDAEESFRYAASIGIFDNADPQSYDSAVTRGSLAHILVNVINKNILVADYSKGILSYKAGDETVLTENKNVYSEKNVMIDTNSETGIYSADSRTAEGTVGIGGKEYKIGNARAKDLILGRLVNVWYRYDNDTDTRTIVYCDFVSDSVITRISDTDLADATDNAVYYYEGASKKQCKYSHLRIIYNGKLVENALSLKGLIGDPDTFSGSLVFVDNTDHDDVIIIEKYSTCIVKSIDIADNKIYDLYGNDISLGTDTQYEIFSSMGKTLGIKDLRINDVLTVFTTAADSQGSSSSKIYCSETQAKNSEINKLDSDTREFIEANDTRYRLTSEYTAAKKAGVCSEIYVGMSGDFLLDYYGNVAGIINVSNTIVGYVVKCNNITEGEAAVEMKIFNENGEMVTMRLKSKCRIDGNMISGGAKQYAALTPDKSSIVRTVVRYKKNSDDEITLLDTVNAGAGGKDDAIAAIGSKSTAMRYYESAFIVKNKVALTSNYISFKVPTPGTNDVDDDTKYSLGRPTNYTRCVYEFYSSDGTGVISAIPDGGIADVMVMYNQRPSLTERLILVNNIKQIWDEQEGQTLISFTGYESNSDSLNTYYIRPDGAYKNNLSKMLTTGMTIYASYDIRMNIVDSVNGYSGLNGDFDTGGSLVFADAKGNAVNTDADGKAITNSHMNSTDTYWDSAGTLLGNVTYIDHDRLVLSMTNGATGIYGIKSARAYRVYESSGSTKVEKASVADIQVGDRVMTYVNLSNVQMLVFYH